MYGHTYMHTYMHAFIHAYIHTYIHAYIHTYMHAYIHACIHTQHIHSNAPVCCTRASLRGRYLPCRQTSGRRADSRSPPSPAACVCARACVRRGRWVSVLHALQWARDERSSHACSRMHAHPYHGIAEVGIGKADHGVAHGCALCPGPFVHKQLRSLGRARHGNDSSVRQALAWPGNPHAASTRHPDAASLPAHPPHLLQSSFSPLPAQPRTL